MHPVVLILALACLALAPAENEAPANQQDDEKEPRLVIKQDALKQPLTKRSIQIERGATLAIRLEFRATGFVWSLKERNKKALQLVGKPKVEKTSNKPGAAEFKVYRFRVRDKGAATFALARPFGKEKTEKLLRVSVKLKGEDDRPPTKNADRRR
jgi:predicted secreted protein